MLECVTLLRDLREFRLPAGTIGTVVFVHKEKAVEVEFVDREGDTIAVLTLRDQDVRRATEAELSSAEWPDPLPVGVDVALADATVSPSVLRY